MRTRRACGGVAAKRAATEQFAIAASQPPGRWSCSAFSQRALRPCVLGGDVRVVAPRSVQGRAPSRIHLHPAQRQHEHAKCEQAKYPTTQRREHRLSICANRAFWSLSVWTSISPRRHRAKSASIPPSSRANSRSYALPASSRSSRRWDFVHSLFIACPRPSTVWR
jgi:hypothetical protein